LLLYQMSVAEQESVVGGIPVSSQILALTKNKLTEILLPS
jgi:hypothetical protein